MIKNVERRFPHINLTKDEVQKCLDSLNVNAIVTDFNLSSSGLSNTNYIVTLKNHQKVVLRIHYNQLTNNGLKELKLSKLLTKIHEIPKVLYYQPANGDDFSYSIIEFMDGINLSEISKSKDLDILYFELGEMLAKLRTIAFPSPGLLGSNLEIISINTMHTNYHHVTNFVLDCLENKNFLLRVDTTLIASLKELMLQNDHLLFVTDEAPHLVHGDFKVENIMVKSSTDGKVHLSGILDWEHARSDTSYGDIATLFRGNYEKDSSNKLAFYAGFTSDGATLIPDWDRASKIIDLVNLCHFLCADENRPVLYSTILTNLQNTINHFSTN